MASVGSVGISLQGEKELRRDLARLSDAVRGPAILRALVAGALPIANEWKRRAPYETGNYRRSIHVGGEGGGEHGDIGGQKVTSTGAEVAVGTNVEYGPRLEFGFVGTDALGRTYHQPARPHARPAIEAAQPEAEREVIAALRQLIDGAVR
jgi:HK97 gp10 family phage protein